MEHASKQCSPYPTHTRSVRRSVVPALCITAAPRGERRAERVHGAPALISARISLPSTPSSLSLSLCPLSRSAVCGLWSAVGMSLRAIASWPAGALFQRNSKHHESGGTHRLLASRSHRKPKGAQRKSDESESCENEKAGIGAHHRESGGGVHS
jgi:hypothetical protein